MITIDKRGAVAPLDVVQINASQALGLRIYDGQGREYARAEGPKMDLRVAGALGHHVVVALDGEGREIERTSFPVDCASGIEDAAGRYRRLLQLCLLSCQKELHEAPRNHGNVHLLDQRIRRGFVLTSRDHIHGHKAMRYFVNWNREWIDAFCEYQRADGMVWDIFAHREDRKPSFVEMNWGKEWCQVVANGECGFARQPVMNDVEHMFIRGIWQTWRTTGDDAWMASRLDNALRALEYDLTSPYTWSKKLGLMHRAFCIDMWDFQSDFDAALVGGDPMLAIPGVTQYGAAHGDSMGLAQACDELTEMLEHEGRTADALRVSQIGRSLRQNLDKHCWNGEFFTHFVPEDPSFERPFGVDQSTQVSLSNAYALNRGIPHEQAVAIIRTYQRIREETRETSPGEWFCIYPPFPRGFHIQQWNYVNGGVAPMVAGELAHGAFEHGFEAYAVDILNRVDDLGRKTDEFPRVWRGRLDIPPKRTFHTVDLRSLANVGFSGTATTPAIPWTNEGENDLHEMPVGKGEFQSVLFDVIDPATNRGAACVGIAAGAPYAPVLEAPVGRQAASLYFLHTLCGGGGALAGDLALHYADGTVHRMYVQNGKQIQGWWMPREGLKGLLSDPTVRVAWRGANAKCPDIGVMVWGLNNPHPDKVIDRLVLNPSIEGKPWMVLGITLSDAPVYLTPSGYSDGIPSPWTVGAIIWALFEGLAGLYDSSANFKTARICPRWAASDTPSVTVTAKFEEGGGYVKYTYDQTDDGLHMLVTGNSDRRRYEILLPANAKPLSVRVNGKPQDYTTKRIEASTYVNFEVQGVGAQDIAITTAKN